MIEKTGILMLIDVVNYTAQSVKRGTDPTQDFTKHFVKTIRRLAKHYNAYFIRIIGDAVLLFFESKTGFREQFLDFTTQLHTASRSGALDKFNFKCKLRMISHFGTFHFEGTVKRIRDFIGPEGIQIFRIEKLTGDQGVFIADSVLNILKSSLNKRFIHPHEVSKDFLDGFTHEICIYELIFPKEKSEMDFIEAIKQLEKLVKGKLKKAKFKDIGRLNSYCLDDNGLITGLNLCYPDISDISFLSQPAFTHLTYLSIVKSQIMDIKPIQHLSQLSKLFLFENKITDISPLQDLSRLTELWLAFNQITDITPLKGLKNIRVATLMHNKISQLPLDITKWGKEIKWEYRRLGEEGIFFEDNPIESPPIEIVKQGENAVANYFNEMAAATEVLLLETKVLLVGHGEVGKTTLMKKLKDNAYVVHIGEECATHGINIETLKLECSFGPEEKHSVDIHLWDFGGQDIYHSTHQFFLTKRSLYLFVWEPRKEEETMSFVYWLNIIKLLGGQSPVIVVMNKSDIRLKAIDEGSFKKEFPNIIHFIDVSCFNGQNILKLTELICQTLSSMPHLKDRLPKVWKDIRNHLKGLNINYINLKEYFDICMGYGLDKNRALFLSDYLHDLGVILHFSQDKILQDTVILNPEWATEAVYKLIDSQKIQADKGKFRFNDLKTYWDLQKYPLEKHHQLIRLMEKFELCFNFIDTHTYFIPELLSPERTPIASDYDDPDTLRFEYRYEFIPGGIVSRFISRRYHLIYEDHFWKNGVELSFEKSTALVIGDALQRKVKIAAVGPLKSELMAIIRSDFDHIHRTLEMERGTNYEEFIPCPCDTCQKLKNPQFFKYSNLLNFKEEKNLPDIQCLESGDMMPIERLLRGIETTPPTADLFALIIECSYYLQGAVAVLKTSEDSRNTFMALLLASKGLFVKDQSRWGVSASSKSQGEVDIKIESLDPNYKTIIEAFILRNLDRTVIKSHVQKLFGYDPSGFKQNFILVYSEADDFSDLWEKYLSYITKIDFPYRRVKGPEIIATSYAEIKAACVHFDREGEETLVYHIFINLNPKRL